jgi:hypothetical protein
MLNDRAYGCLMRALLLFVVGMSGPSARAEVPPPMLEGLQVIEMADKVSRKAIDIDQFTISVAPFDAANGEWLIRFDRGGSASGILIYIQSFLVTVNEGTGLVCMRHEVRGACIAQGDVSDDLAAARARIQVQAEARKFPAPDLNGMMAVLIRHALPAESTHAIAGDTPRYYVSLHPPGGGSATDLPAEVIVELKGMGVVFLPGSAWVSPGDVAMSSHWLMMIIAPVRRADGNYDVVYDFYCGTLCASTHVAVMSHDTSGWHVVSSRTTIQS